MCRIYRLFCKYHFKGIVFGFHKRSLRIYANCTAQQGPSTVINIVAHIVFDIWGLYGVEEEC